MVANNEVCDGDFDLGFDLFFLVEPEDDFFL